MHHATITIAHLQAQRPTPPPALITATPHRSGRRNLPPAEQAMRTANAIAGRANALQRRLTSTSAEAFTAEQLQQILTDLGTAVAAIDQIAEQITAAGTSRTLVRTRVRQRSSTAVIESTPWATTPTPLLLAGRPRSNDLINAPIRRSI